MKKSYLFFLFIIIAVSCLTAVSAQTLTRGPYLQMGNQTSVTIRWRTNIATNSRVTYGTVFGSYPNVVDDLTSTTEHIVSITGLTADTKYFYTIGSTALTLQATNTNYVRTMPVTNSTRKMRFLAFGDCGNASTRQIDVKNAALNYISSNEIDALLTIGDNAYSSGLDNEFQTEFFDIYKDDLLKYTKLYTVPGNHDYGNSSANTGVRNNAYYSSFSIPVSAQCGGIASGSEAYYSYDIGNVHFVALDSYGKEDANTTKLYDTTGAQCTWLKNDLAANTKIWTVVYFHHPPYTKTSHSSDYNSGAGELDLVAVREKFIRILERYGVDLVLCGHSHGYERSYLLKEYYNTYASPLEDAAFNAAAHTATGNTQNAKYDGTAGSCAYTYNSGKYNHGSVYVVSGSSGQSGGSSTGYPHNAMYYSNITNGGVFYFEADSNRLDAEFLSYSGTGGSVTPVIRDQFTIFKDVNNVTDTTVAQNDVLNLTASWRGNYFWSSNGGAATQTVLINTSVAGTYNFTVTDAASGSCLKDSFHVIVTAPLPVTLASFTTAIDNNKVHINWSASQEINNHYFLLEKSTDGVNYSPFQKVNGAGNSNSLHQYAVTDFAPAEGYNYYKLSQISYNGHVTYAGIQKVLYKSSSGLSTGIINSARGEVTLVYNVLKSGIITTLITDAGGRKAEALQIQAVAGANTQKIKLPTGLYIVTVTGSTGEKTSYKIIVQ
jgi:Calcineurin-like phosphoesterase/Purple acid Phosphatase, N-terminal domain